MVLPNGAASAAASEGDAFSGPLPLSRRNTGWNQAYRAAERQEARDEAREATHYRANEFGGGDFLDDLNRRVDQGEIPPRPANFGDYTMQQRYEHVWGPHGYRPQPETPFEIAEKAITFTSVAFPFGGPISNTAGRAVARQSARMAAAGRHEAGDAALHRVQTTVPPKPGPPRVQATRQAEALHGRAPFTRERAGPR